MTSDLRDARDALEADMAEHQRRFAGEPTAAANQTMAADAVQRLEYEQRDAKSAPAPTAPEAPALPPVSTREGKHGEYTVFHAEDDDTKVRVASESERWFMAHALPRLELLLTKKDTGPLGQASWCDRVLAVMELRSRVPSLAQMGLQVSAKDLERRYMKELLELLEDSNRVFGDWKADAPTTLTVAVPR